ncbi:hypothetical protein Rhe02_02610 [Rhizocola hellebori]|uniref:LamG-like jellyroll fold domain-containing protein n=1 Tax=Rhizocola hellebori TaxID=1392758 RepID=A0A8J3Q2C7_9ACTN|nr:LamG domain-containing protein [Rhizocola hellebori]GIH02194.1 hypothetical protein Rhe02_02610 [Rhizocola hellebori]
MSRHRQNEDEQTMLLPQTVEQHAASDRAVRRRPPRRLIVLAVVGVLLVGGGVTAWVLSEPSDLNQLLPPVTTSTSGKNNAAVEGLGEASPAVSPSVPSSPVKPRVSPSTLQPTTSPPTTEVLVLPLLAHYPFNEAAGASAADATGGGKTATVAGPAAFVPGKLGNAIDLNGAGQYVSLPAGIFRTTPEFTFAAWVRLDTISTWSRLFDFGTGTTVNMFLTPRSDAGTIRFAITTGGSGKQERINAPAPLPVGTWTHVAVTLSGGVGILYLNRVEVARTSGMTLTPASLGNTTQTWIGRSEYQADPYLDGAIDDLRFYSRALTPTELATLP